MEASHLLDSGQSPAQKEVKINNSTDIFFFLLTQFYDQILLKLNPTGNDLFLIQ